MPLVVIGDNADRQKWSNLRGIISETGIGRRLLSAMDTSRNVCSVTFVDDSEVASDGGAVAGVEFPELNKVPGLAIVRHFAPDDAVKETAARDRMSDEIAAGWKSYFKLHGNKNVLLKKAIDDSPLGKEEILIRLKNNRLKDGLGIINRDKLKDYVTKPEPIPSEILWRLIWILRDSIEPGDGAPARIKIGESIGEWEQGKEPRKAKFARRAKSGTLSNKDGHVIVFHELVHAWRIMEGRRIVTTGWEEEAMTMGLPPFADEEFTENKYRQALKMDTATRHGSGTFSSQTMFIQSQDPNDWGKEDKIFHH